MGERAAPTGQLAWVAVAALAAAPRQLARRLRLASEQQLDAVQEAAVWTWWSSS